MRVRILSLVLHIEACIAAVAPLIWQAGMLPLASSTAYASYFVFVILGGDGSRTL